MNLILQHAIERVERPGGSHEGVGRKKKARVWKKKIQLNRTTLFQQIQT